MTTKLGVHVSTGPRGGFGEVCQAAPAVVLAVGEGGALLEAKEKSDGRTLTIYRDITVYPDAPPGIDHMTEAGAIAAAEFLWPRLREAYDLNPADYYQPTNEVGGDNEQTLANLVVYESRLMDLAERDGYRLAIGSPAGGSPASWELWLNYIVPLIRRAGEGGHLYSRHAYGGVVMASSGLLTAEGPKPADSNAGRPFVEAAYLDKIGVATPMVITEAGVHGGMRFAGAKPLLEDAARFDALCGQHDNIWGFCLWTFGDHGPFPANIQPASKYLAAYVGRMDGGQGRPYPYAGRPIRSRPGPAAIAAPEDGVDGARFVTFESDHDLDAVPAGSAISVTWRLRNTGESTWRQGYHVVHVDTGLISDRLRVPLLEATGRAAVDPGQEAEVTLHMRVPDKAGEAYRSVWQLQDRQGEFFGPRFWVRAVTVANLEPKGPRAGEPPGDIRLQTGININPDAAHANPIRSEVLRGLDWVRWPFKAADKDRSIGASFGEYDGLVRGYAQKGAGSLIVLNQQTMAGADAPWKKGGDWSRYARQFAAAGKAIASRYADLGGEVAYEIWNEGDNPKTPQVSVYVAPEFYALLLSRAAAAIREAAPKARIVLGGLATGPRDAVAYVNKVREALGGSLPVDAIGIHPYGRWTGKRPFPGWGFGELAEVIDVFAEALPAYPLWITEIGIPGREKPLPEEMLPAVADYMLDLYRQVAANHAGWVEAIIWYGWADSMENAGIVDGGGRAKPALFKAFRQVRDRAWEAERMKVEG
jgi:hypothetical protein